MYSMEVQSINGIEASKIYQGRVYGDGIYRDIYNGSMYDANHLYHAVTHCRIFKLSIHQMLNSSKLQDINPLIKLHLTKVLPQI